MKLAWSLLSTEHQVHFTLCLWLLWNERNGLLYGASHTLAIDRVKDYMRGRSRINVVLS